MFTFPIGFMSASAAELTYQNKYTSIVNATSVTFSNCSIGNASDRQYIFFCVYAAGSVAHTLSAVIDPSGSATPATKIHQGNDNGGAGGYAIFYGEVASGTTVDIQVTTNTISWVDIALYMYTLKNVQDISNVTTYTDTNEPSSIVATVPSGGIGVFLAGARDAAAGATFTFSGTGVFQDDTVNLENYGASGVAHIEESTTIGAACGDPINSRATIGVTLR